MRGKVIRVKEGSTVVVGHSAVRVRRVRGSSVELYIYGDGKIAGPTVGGTTADELERMIDEGNKVDEAGVQGNGGDRSASVPDCRE